MIPFAAFKLACAFVSGAGLGIGLFYIYLKTWLKGRIEERYQNDLQEWSEKRGGKNNG